jgi:hypothetical protein
MIYNVPTGTKHHIGHLTLELDIPVNQIILATNRFKKSSLENQTVETPVRLIQCEVVIYSEVASN